MSGGDFDDLWPWEIELVVAAYIRAREDAERLALAHAHTLSVWVWAAFGGRLPAFEEVVPAREPLGSRGASDEARTALSEANWTDWFAARRASRS